MRRLALVLAAAAAAASLLPQTAYAEEPPRPDSTNLVPPEAQRSPPPSEPNAEPSSPIEILPTQHPQRVAAYIFAGTAVVGIAVGAAFGALALSNTNSWNASNQTSPAAASYRNLANQDSVVCDVGFGAAAIAGITSLVLFLKPEEPPPASSSAVSFSVAPLLSAHTAGAGALVHF